MNNLKESFRRRKDWYFLTAFCALLVFILLNMMPISRGIGQFNNAISPLIYGIVFAFILNVPMSFYRETAEKVFQRQF